METQYKSHRPTREEQNAQNIAQGPAASPSKDEPQIKIDGFNQVLEMLKIAEPSFRESLLKRLSQRDPELGRALRQSLGV